ncbi:hypothetical protein [Bacillus sp. EB600]|uniref:hypothetical protein n=1 Tax=Bacillus sp. EB600 TaxID=2806345 RepID=UPI002109019C|nr:hypothetical protein [Bacillus sp. EB600]MCQ6282996.1 hypothetical protein [Bacillus sp. EB600]
MWIQICRELHQFNEFYEHMIVKKEDEEWKKLVVYLIFYTNRMMRKIKDKVNSIKHNNL